MRQELLAHKQCQELTLEGLSEVAVEEYLEHRFPVHVFPARLAQVLHQRTGGIPLFLVNLVNDLVTHGLLTDGEGGWMLQGEIDVLLQQVPEGSRQLIAAQIDVTGESRYPANLGCCQCSWGVVLNGRGCRSA